MTRTEARRTLPFKDRSVVPLAYRARMSKRTYGEIPGFPPGSAFTNRLDLSKSQVHRPNQGGICGGADGAESIVVSGGYIDDEDFGGEIIYTGQGGNDPVTKRQVADQRLTHGNLGLARSQLDGNPVRLVRGADGDPRYSPTRGLRYDGLFRVVDHWTAIGIDGFKIMVLSPGFHRERGFALHSRTDRDGHERRTRRDHDPAPDQEHGRGHRREATPPLHLPNLWSPAGHPRRTLRRSRSHQTSRQASQWPRCGEQRSLPVPESPPSLRRWSDLHRRGRSGL